MAKDLWNTDIDVSAWDDVLTQWFERYWDAFVDPDSGIIYDNPVDLVTRSRADCDIGTFQHTSPEDFQFPDDYARPDLGSWPTPEEVAASVPAINGWFTPIENAASRCGMLLAGLVRGAFALTEERRQQAVQHLLRGMIALWEVPGRTGFVCRGFLPQSGAFYRQTSHDQIPPYLYGLAACHASSYVTHKDRNLIAQVVDSVLGWLEEGNWNMRLFGDSPEIAFRLLKDNNDPGTNTKLLAMLAMAHQVTGSDRWGRLYRKFRDEDNRKRFAHIARRDKSWLHFDPWQITMFLRFLSDYESDQECRDFYNEQRWLFMHTLAYFCEHPVPPPEDREMKTELRVLPDWRPALSATVRADGFDPTNGRFWYQVGANLKEMSPASSTEDMASPFDVSLFGLYSYILAAYRNIMFDWPKERPTWGAERISGRLKEVFDRARPGAIPENVYIVAYAVSSI